MWAEPASAKRGSAPCENSVTQKFIPEFKSGQMLMTGTDAGMNMHSGSAGILHALRGVIDPEYGYNIVDMGLIYRLEINAGKVNVVMTLPARDYPSRDYILMAMKKCIQRLSRSNNLEIQLIWDPPWSPRKMTSRKAYVEFPDDHLWGHNE